ncbi:hypothetical protein K439DRAFT_1617235 [Ramaria rubella]|nr:hypothetical protein K439DRAFT_1618402 [Ramaria rubella]KAF8583791.1 hypothetical protein K439DRAFT_1617235 [Ramaria rubella]
MEESVKAALQKSVTVTYILRNDRSFKFSMAPFPPTPGSDSSLLAFSYNDRDPHDIDYTHDSSQPSSPAPIRAASYPPPPRGAPPLRLSSLNLARLTSQSKRREMEDEEGDGSGFVRGRRDPNGIMDPFSRGEMIVIGASSLAVLGLIVVAIMLTIGGAQL